MTIVLAIILALAMLLFAAAIGAHVRDVRETRSVSVRAAVRPRHRPF